MSFKMTAVVQAESSDFLTKFATRAAGVTQVTIIPEEAVEPVLAFVRNINGITTFHVAKGEDVLIATLRATSETYPMIDPMKREVSGNSSKEIYLVVDNGHGVTVSRRASPAGLNTTTDCVVSDPLPIKITQTSVPAQATASVSTKTIGDTYRASKLVPVTRDSIFAAMLVADPKASSFPSSAPSSPRSKLSGSAKEFVQSNESSPTVTKAPKSQFVTVQHTVITKPVRPPTTDIVARRIIGHHLGIDTLIKGGGHALNTDSILDKSGFDEKEVKEITEAVPEQKKSGIMAFGLSGSRWADPETREKTKPRPIEDFYDEQLEAENRRVRYVNEHLSLKLEPTPNAFVEKKVSSEAVSSEAVSPEAVSPGAVSVPVASMTREQMFAAMETAMAL